MSSLQTLFVDEVKDIYNGEKQILRALPKMVKAAGPALTRAASRSE